jgi:N-formylglutamate deformylase
VLLWDAHSIRSEIPWLFDGRLPDLNIGTAKRRGRACRPSAAVVRPAATRRVSAAWSMAASRAATSPATTGSPAEHVHAVQLEKCQSLYMQEVPPFAMARRGPRRAIQPVLQVDGGAALHAPGAVCR